MVLHYTVLDLPRTLARLCDPSAEVSAHYVIAPDGAVTLLVPEQARAWHAGAGRWGDISDVNSASIGIELVNAGNHPFAAAQMAALEGLLPAILARWNIAPKGVIGHSDLAPARKADPGTRFDWHRLARGGLAVWPEPAAPGDLIRDLNAFGYDPDLPPDLLLRAFRLRFRPWASGPADATDAALAADLAARFAVDRAPPTA